MKYCNLCVLPDTRPHLKIMQDGICNACHAWHAKKIHFNWQEREQAFCKLIRNAKKKSSSWDCVIPVSGGKDSTWQVVKALEWNLKPLCVTWRTPARNRLGQKNLDNLIQLGVDHIDFTINPEIEKKFILATFAKAGSLAIPMHMALFAIPLRIAINYRIPLVFWGENSGIEYGGKEKDLLGATMSNAWLKEYGVTQGTKVEDWVSSTLTWQDLYVYLWPSDKELAQAKVTAVFLGWYFPWDPLKTYEIARSHGFQELSKQPKTGFYRFADVDDEFIIVLHHWLKWYKFGFTRLWDNLALEIRSERISRDTALDIIRQVGDEYPEEAMQKFCRWAGFTQNEFLAIAEKFRNKSIWTQENGYWEINSFLIENWNWKIKQYAT